MKREPKRGSNRFPTKLIILIIDLSYFVGFNEKKEQR